MTINPRPKRFTNGSLESQAVGNVNSRNRLALKLLATCRRFCLAVALATLASSSLQAQSISLNGDYTPVFDGGGLQWDVGGDGSGSLRIGVSSGGGMQLSGGYTVNSFLGFVGDEATGNGNVSVNGTGSAWNNSQSLIVGSFGTGTVSITNGGTASSNQGNVGAQIGSMGTASIDGAGSTWSSSSNLIVGSQGTGTLNVTNGGSVSGGAVFFGLLADGDGSALIDGAGSSLVSNGNLTVGLSGTGSLEVTNGGMVSNQFNGFLGTSSGGNGMITIDGAGSSWDVSRDLFIGGTTVPSDGEGTLQIRQNGSVSVDRNMRVWEGGIVNVENGTLDANFLFVQENGQVNLDGGVINAAVINLGADSDPTQFSFVDGTLSANAFIGNLTQQGGTLGPGNSGGSTSIVGDYNLAVLGEIEFGIGGGIRRTEYDAVNLSSFGDSTGLATLDGTIDVNLIDGFTGSLGDTFLLVDAAGGIAGTPIFDFQDAVLASNLKWDTSSFISSGSISIVAVPEPSHLILLGICSVFTASRRRRRIS